MPCAILCKQNWHRFLPICTNNADFPSKFQRPLLLATPRIVYCSEICGINDDLSVSQAEFAKASPINNSFDKADIESSEEWTRSRTRQHPLIPDRLGVWARPKINIARPTQRLQRNTERPVASRPVQYWLWLGILSQKVSMAGYKLNWYQLNERRRECNISLERIGHRLDCRLTCWITKIINRCIA